MLKCPVCDSENVRVSHSRRLWEFAYEWRGLQRYRCRDCRATFHHPLGPGEKFASRPRCKRSPQPDKTARIALNRLQQKASEAGLFLLLLIAFYMAMKLLIY